jgi:hypothetical protein
MRELQEAIRAFAFPNRIRPGDQKENQMPELFESKSRARNFGV